MTDSNYSKFLDLGIVSVEFSGDEETVREDWDEFVGDSNLIEMVEELKRMDHDLAEEYESEDSSNPMNGGRSGFS